MSGSLARLSHESVAGVVVCLSHFAVAEHTALLLNKTASRPLKDAPGLPPGAREPRLSHAQVTICATCTNWNSCHCHSAHCWHIKRPRRGPGFTVLCQTRRGRCVNARGPTLPRLTAVNDKKTIFINPHFKAEKLHSAALRQYSHAF